MERTDNAARAARVPPALSAGLRFDLAEMAGAVADLGVLVPIAVTLIVANHLSPTAVLLPAGILYIAGGLLYRVPIPVQPLKAFGAIAIATGLGPDAIAAGALVMGGLFLVLGVIGLLDAAARLVPGAVIRGVQLTVGLLLLSIAWGLVVRPPHAFDVRQGGGGPTLLVLGAAVAVTALLLRRRPVSLALVVVAVVAVIGSAHGVRFGPSPLHLPALSWATLSSAVTTLVIPQLPLTFANSCLATADTARTYFRERAGAVRPGRLAMTLGAANLLAGSMSGMPVCHGAGGMTAHASFGARTGGAPVAIGAALVITAVAVGSSLAALLAGFPLAILAGLLAAAGLLHIALLRDLRGWRQWAVALAVGLTGTTAGLALAVTAGVASWWGLELGSRWWRRRGLRRSDGIGAPPEAGTVPWP